MEISKNENVNLIFARSNAGNSLIESDIESIDKSYYPRILKMLNRLTTSERSSDTTKYKKLINNKDLLGAFEYKEFAVRIICRQIDEDSVYVNFVTVKKSTNGLKDTNSIISRLKSTKEDYEEIKLAFQDPETKSKIVQENLSVLDRVASLLESDNKLEKPKESRNTVQPPKEKNKINNPFDGIDPVWISMYKLAEAIYKKEGTIKMKVTHKVGDVNIGRFLYEQKVLKANGELSENKIELLDTLEINWTLRTAKETAEIPKRKVKPFNATSIVSLYETMYRLFGDNYKELADFELRMEESIPVLSLNK